MSVRRLIRGATYLTLASFLGRLLAVLSFPILTHFLSPDAYGVAALATTLIGIFTILGIAGQDTSFVRCFRDSGNVAFEQVDHFFSRYAWLMGAVGGVVAALSWQVYLVATSTRSSDWVSLFIFLGVFGGIVSTFSQLRARLTDNYRRLAFAQLLSGVAATAACVAAAYAWRRDEVALMVAVISYWTIVIMLPSADISALRRKSNLSWSHRRSMMVVGLPLIINAPAYWVISSSDRWFLAANGGKSELGIYSVGVAIAGIGQMVTSALNAVWGPELFRHVEGVNVRNDDHLSAVLTILIWLVITTWFGISMFGDIIVKLLAGPSFQEAAIYIPWLATAYMFYGINQFLGFGIVIHRKTLPFPFIWLSGVILALLLNSLLVPRFGGVGAALAQCVTYLALAALTLWVSRRYTPFQPVWKEIGLSGGIYLVVMLFSRNWIPANDAVTGIAVRMAVALVVVVGSFLIVALQIGNLGDKIFASLWRGVGRGRNK